MASNYPGSLDSFDTIASDKKTSDAVGGRTHRQMHNDLGDAIEAVQSELGTNPSGSYATVKARFEAIEGSTLPQVDAKGDLIVGTADNTYDNLGVGTNDTVLLAASGETKGVKWAQVPTAAIQDSAVTSAKLGSDVRIGNLLTANVASIETDASGWAANTGSPTVARSTSQARNGSASLSVTATANGTLSVIIPSGTAHYVPVTAGETYTMAGSFYAATNSRSAYAAILWYTSGGSFVVQSNADAITTGTGAWVESRLTAVAPATAAYARVTMIVSSAATSDVFYVDRIGFWKGTGGQWAMPGQPILGLTEAPIGNLLTANQASGTDTLGDTTGFEAYSATVTSSTDEAAQGTRAIKVVTTAGYGGARLNYSGSAATMPVEPGVTYTFQADCKQTSGTAGGVKATIYWFTSNGTTAASTAYVQGNMVTMSSSWQTVKVTGVAPANAALAFMIVYSVSAGETVMTRYEDKYSFHRGASGTWAMPGVPVVGQSSIASNGAVHLSGTGSPEGVVTAAPGSTWLQTDATTDVKGWIRWVKATGTGNTGWVAGPEADTGRRNVAVDIDADWAVNASAGYIRLQRVGERVYFEARLDRVTASGSRGNYDAVYTVPSGFAPRNAYNVRGLAIGTGGVAGFVGDLSTPGQMEVWFPSGGTWAASDDVFFTAEWYTNDAWPSSLPGSAA